jgi:Na+-driven multidrug efflux pump
MLKATVLQMPIIAIAIGGMMLFQATSLWWRACIVGLMQGLICCVPISFIFQAIAISSNNVNVFIWTPFIVAVVASIANTLWSTIYMYKHFRRNNQNKRNIKR